MDPNDLFSLETPGTPSPAPEASILGLYYGTIEEANQYFAMRLHADAWNNADASDYPKALWNATQIIDALNFKGNKHAVWLCLQKYLDVNDYGLLPVMYSPALPELLVMPLYAPPPQVLRDAESSQPLEFPRDEDTSVPQAIRFACYETAYSLLDGKNLDLEIEAMGISQISYSGAQTTFNRQGAPVEHVINGVMNVTAWRYLRPFLRSPDQIKVTRIS